MYKKTTLIALFLISMLFLHEEVFGKSKAKLHPMNAKWIKQGLMKYPRYFPEIPRIPAEMAYGLYLQNKALFVYASHKNDYLIVGGIHFTEAQLDKINPDKLPFKPGQILIIY